MQFCMPFWLWFRPPHWTWLSIHITSRCLPSWCLIMWVQAQQALHTLQMTLISACCIILNNAGTETFIGYIFLYVFFFLSLSRSKEAYSRNLRITTSSRCLIAVGPYIFSNWKHIRLSLSPMNSLTVTFCLSHYRH